MMGSMAIDPVQIRDDYVDNADYAEVNSLTKARAFQTACKRSFLCPQEISKDGETIRFPDARVIQQELASVEAWIAANGSGGVKHFDFTGYRD